MWGEEVTCIKDVNEVFTNFITGQRNKLGIKVSLSQLHYMIVSIYTVESPNNGHIGDWTFVRCREMSASRRLLIH